MKDQPPNSGFKCGQHVNYPAVVGFLYQDYRYRSAIAQFQQDPGLTPVHPTEIEPGIAGSVSTSSPQRWTRLLHIRSISLFHGITAEGLDRISLITKRINGRPRPP